MRLGIVFWSVVVAMCVAQRASQAQGPGTCCYKRTFGYDQTWTPQPASPQVMLQPLVVACPSGLSDGSVVSPMGDGIEGHVGEVMMPQIVVMPSKPIFRLCIACPPNASVIIDGQKTKSGGRIRQYQLELSEANPGRYIEVVILQGNEEIQPREAIWVEPGATRTIVVPSKKRQDQPAAFKQQVDAVPSEPAPPPAPAPPIPPAAP